VPQQALPRPQLVKIAPSVITVHHQPSPLPHVVLSDRLPLSPAHPSASCAPQTAAALKCAQSLPTVIASTFVTYTNALRDASSIKTKISVSSRPLDTSVPATLATAPGPRTRSSHVRRALTPRMLVLYPMGLALFVPRPRIAHKLRPNSVHARQAHSTRLKENRSASLVPQAFTPAHLAPPPALPAALASTVLFRAQLLRAAAPSTSISPSLMQSLACPAPIRSCHLRLKPRAIPKIRRHRLTGTPTLLVCLFLRQLQPFLVFLSYPSFGLENHLQLVPFTRLFACMFSCLLRMRCSKAAPFGFC
jgi:hypothetical protein